MKQDLRNALFMFTGSGLTCGGIFLLVLRKDPTGLFGLIFGIIIFMVVWGQLNLVLLGDGVRNSRIWKNIKEEAVIICIGFLAMGWAWLHYESKAIDGGEEFGNYGDFFGGVAGPILSFLTLFLIVKQNSNFEVSDEEKVKLDVFSRQIESLGNMISNLRYNVSNGEDSTVSYHGLLALYEFRKAGTRVTNGEKNNFGGPLLGVVNLYESLFRQILLEIVENHEKPDSRRKIFIQKKYEMLKTQFSGHFVNELFLVRDLYIGHLIFNELFTDHAIRGLKVYFMANGNVYRYPDESNISALRAILNYQWSPASTTIVNQVP